MHQRRTVTRNAQRNVTICCELKESASACRSLTNSNSLQHWRKGQPLHTSSSEFSGSLLVCSAFVFLHKSVQKLLAIETPIVAAVPSVLILCICLSLSLSPRLFLSLVYSRCFSVSVLCFLSVIFDAASTKRKYQRQRNCHKRKLYLRWQCRRLQITLTTTRWTAVDFFSFLFSLPPPPYPLFQKKNNNDIT